MEPKRQETQNAEPETERIIRDRLATFDEDKKTAKPAREVISEIQRKLKHPVPR